MRGSSVMMKHLAGAMVTITRMLLIWQLISSGNHVAMLEAQLVLATLAQRVTIALGRGSTALRLC